MDIGSLVEADESFNILCKAETFCLSCPITNAKHIWSLFELFETNSVFEMHVKAASN